MEKLVQLVVCNLDDEEYGIKIKHVQEIIRLLDITRVPNAPFFIEGVINLRGMVIPVLDLRNLFGKSRRVNTDATRIIIVNIQGTLFGVIVDSVSEVISFSNKQTEAPPSLSNNVNSVYFSGVGKLGEKLLILLNVEQIMQAVGKS